MIVPLNQFDHGEDNQAVTRAEFNQTIRDLRQTDEMIIRRSNANFKILKDEVDGSLLASKLRKSFSSYSS